MAEASTIKYPDCKLHNGKIEDQFCGRHRVMLCSECAKQRHRHQRCHVNSIAAMCKVLDIDDIETFKALAHI